MRRRYSPTQHAVGLLMLILLLPVPSLLYQQVHRLVTQDPAGSGLNGMLAEQPDELQWSWQGTWQAWFSGKLQKRFATWYTDNLGPLRRILIRLTSGIYYLAFDRSLSSNSQIVIGKHRVLFQEV